MSFKYNKRRAKNGLRRQTEQRQNIETSSLKTTGGGGAAAESTRLFLVSGQ